MSFDHPSPASSPQSRSYGLPSTETETGPTADGVEQAPTDTAPPSSGPAPGTDLASDLGAALKFAGNTLLRNPLAYGVSGAVYTLVLLLIVAVAIIVPVVVLVNMLSNVSDPNEVPGRELLIFYGLLLAMMLPTVPLMILWESGAGRAAEIVLEGGRPTISQALIGPARIMLTALLAGVITTIGFLLLYIPGLIASVLLFYAIPASAKGASPVEAIKQSVALARAHLAPTLVAWLVLNVVASIAGAFIIPMVIAIPFYVLFQLGMFERLSGRELPEPAQG